MLTTVTTDTTTTRVTHVIHVDSLAAFTPVEPEVIEEPQIADEDTSTVHPVTVAAPAPHATMPVIPIPDVVTAEPVLLVIEEPYMDEEDTTPVSQNMESVTDHSKG